MNAVEIIDEIKHLPPVEKARVIRFVQTLEGNPPWAAQELTDSAIRLSAEGDPSKAQILKEQIAEGFYGGHA